MSDNDVRLHIARMLTWQAAHASFEHAVEKLSPTLHSVQPSALPYSLWQLLEHLRLTQFDILDFCRNPAYVEPKWPDDYWPSAPAPPSKGAWKESVERFIADRAGLVSLAEDPSVDLYAVTPHGTGQTYLRELLLAADHNAYHVGEMILVRRLLGAWPPE